MTVDIRVILKNSFILIFLALFLSGCVTGPDGFFKRSANNKLFDTKGFHGGKRAPLYNKKYITKAKANIVSGNYDEDDNEDDDDDLYETENVTKENIETYKMMIADDLIQQRKLNKNPKNNRFGYPSLIKANSRLADDYEKTDNRELKAEMEQIKDLLKQTRTELASKKCPATQKAEDVSEELDKVVRKSKAQGIRYEPADTNDSKSEIIGPVKSL